MNIRLFREDDYSTLVDWANKRNINYPPLDFLSDIGFVVENSCACFLYVTNSKVCLIEALIANPDISKEARNESLKSLFDYVINLLKDKEYKYIYCSVETEILKQRLKETNFLISEKPTYVGLRVL